MATAAAKIEYADSDFYGSAFNGSAAYDLDRVVGGVPLPEEEYERQPSPEEQQRERINRRLREREQARTREREKAQVFGIPIMGIIGAIAAAALMISVLMGYIELAAISGETSQVRSSIEALTDKSEALNVRYEATFNMAEVEAYAVNILGMTKGTGPVYHSAYMSDRAEILAPDETAGLGARLIRFLKDIPEYFK